MFGRSTRYCKTNDNVPYAYMKLVGKSASISVYESSIVMDTSVTIKYQGINFDIPISESDSL